MSDAKHDLTQGGIFRALLRIALPLMGTQFMNMLYNLTDMFWLGRVGSDAVAASGTGGLFMWLSVGLLMIGKVGAEIGVSQARGRGDITESYRFSRAALYLSAGLGLLYGAFLFFLRRPLVGFFNFQETHVAADTAVYLGIMALGMPFNFMSSSLTGSFNASGNARTPFVFSCVGLVMNMCLDPLLILVFDLGVGGAAAASVFSQFAVFLLMLYAVKNAANRPFKDYRFFGGQAEPVIGSQAELASCADPSGPQAAPDEPPDWLSPLKKPIRQIFAWTIPICLESSLFCMLTMITSRFEVSFGAHAIAMSRIGSQVESLTWLVGAGFGSALTSFVGQNYGAGRKDRIDRGVRYSVYFMTAWGVMVTAVLFFGGGLAFSLFLPDPALRGTGIMYMRILAVCQIPMCLEAVAGNAFKGQGRTIPPSVSSITSCVIRVPLAYVLSKTPLGLLGIWVAVSFSAFMRGVWICIWYGRARKKNVTGQRELLAARGK